MFAYKQISCTAMAADGTVPVQPDAKKQNQTCIFEPCSNHLWHFLRFPIHLQQRGLQHTRLQGARRLQRHHQQHPAGSHLRAHDRMLLNRQVQPRAAQRRPVRQDDADRSPGSGRPGLGVGEHALKCQPSPASPSDTFSNKAMNNISFIFSLIFLLPNTQ